MAGSLRRTGLTLALPGLVALSTALHWYAGQRLHGLWILPDEAIYADRALQIWRHGSLPLLHGQGTGYGILYPIVAGLPLSFGKIATGYASLKLLQALVMSLVAVPLAVYGRRLVPPWYALLAAALALASPLLLYSGMVMTEVLFYPVAAVALLAVARAVETAAWRDQLLALAWLTAAVLTRVQAVSLFAAFAAAALLDAAFGRNRSKLRSFWPVWTLVGAGVVVASVRPGVLGAYASTVRGGYPVTAGLRLTGEHLAYLVLSTGVAPAVGLVLLGIRAIRGREQSAAVRALVAVTVSAVAIVVLQVGFFAGRFAPHLLGRDLAALPPALFLCFALWLSRDAPRMRWTTGLVTFAIVAAAAAAPWNGLASVDALPDTFDLSALLRLAKHVEPATVVALLGAAWVFLIVLVPRRLTLVLPVGVLAMLAAGSVVAADQVRDRVQYDQVNLVGVPPDWIDRQVAGRVAYLYDGESYWNGVWQVRFWNHTVDDVYSVAPARVPGPMRQQVVRIGADGRLPTHDRYVVASDPHVFVGTPIAHLTQPGIDTGGLTLWRLEGEPRLSLVKRDILPNGDMASPARVTAYDCGGGQLQLTLLPKATRVVTVTLDSKVVLEKSIAGLSYWNGTVSVPASATPRLCQFVIEGQTLLGSTRIDFVRG